MVAGSPVYYELHIQPLFRKLDREHMLALFDLWKYQDVSNGRVRKKIKARVKAGDMPPSTHGGPWPKEWVDLFSRWIDQGCKQLQLATGQYEAHRKGKKVVVHAKGTRPGNTCAVWLQPSFDDSLSWDLALYLMPTPEKQWKPSGATFDVSDEFSVAPSTKQLLHDSTLSIDNHSLVDLWLVWSGDASSTDFVPNGHPSKHGGGSIFAANFLITVYRNNGGRIGDKVGNAAIAVHGADAGELVVRDNFLWLFTATDAIKIGLLIIGTAPRRTAMTSFARDVRPLFRDVDVAHMKDLGLDLSDYQQVKDQAQPIMDRVSSTDDGFRMPPPPDAPWTKSQIDLFRQWMTDGYPA